MPITHPQSEERLLLVDLSPEEAAEVAQELAIAVKEFDSYRDAMEDYLDGVKRTRKAKTKELERLAGGVTRLAEKVESGQAEKEVACDWLYDLPGRSAYLVRRDTGTPIQRRPLAEEETQAVLGEVLQEPTPEQLEAWASQFGFNEGVPEAEPDENEDDGA